MKCNLFQTNYNQLSPSYTHLSYKNFNLFEQFSILFEFVHLISIAFKTTPREMCSNKKRIKINRQFNHFKRMQYSV